MSYEIKGEIIVLEETKTYGNNGFQKRILVVKTEGEYPQTVPVDFVQDKCAILDQYAVGQQVTVAFNLRGSESNGRYFPSLQAWKIEGEPLGSVQPEKAPVPPKEAFDTASDNDEEEDLDPLPF